MFLSKIMTSYLKDLNALLDDLMELKPTLFGGVPRVFERVHEGMETSHPCQPKLYKIINFG